MMKRSSVLYFPGDIRRKTYALQLFLSLLIFIIPAITLAQDNTMYLMPAIPQANQLNPAYFQPCRIYVELPVISSVKEFTRNSAFGFHDVVHTGTGPQSGTYYLDLANLEKNIKKNNYFQTEIDIDLLGFGFGLKGWYFTFGIANHSEFLLSYPRDLILLKDGNWQVANGRPVQINLKHLGFENTIWNSLGVSAAREINDGLRIGVRLKYVQGMANITSVPSELKLTTTSNPISLAASVDYRINASFPVVPGYTNNGLVNSLNFNNSFKNIPSDFIFNGNGGLGIDGGIIHDLDEITQVSASFTDLGFIRWRKNTHNFTATGNFTFSGIDLDKYQANPGQTDLIKALQDSISNAFTASNSINDYTTLLPVKIFGGITRALLPNLRAGAMTRIEIYNRHVMPSISFSMNYSPMPSLAASLSYTIMNNKFNQIGAGIALGNRGAQFYLVTDNIPVRFTKDTGSSLIWPYNARMLSMRFGLNMLFGCNKKEDKQRPKSHKQRDPCPAYW
jgi:hypothetical protein